MQTLFEKAFSEPNEAVKPMEKEVDEVITSPTMETINEDDIIVVGKEEVFTTADVINTTLSPLKLQRQKEKERKEQRKQKQKIDRIRQRQSNYKMKEHNEAQRKMSAEVHKPKQAKWNEIQRQSLSVWSHMKSYEEIATQATFLINNPEFTVDDNTKSQVTQRVNLILRDLDSLRTRWSEICKPIEGKSGPVELEEYPLFYVVYEDILQLGVDVVNVLTDPCTMLSEIMTAILAAVNNEVEKNKLETPTNEQ